MLQGVQAILKEMATVKKKREILKTKKFMSLVHKKTDMFPENEHHDTHEFLNWTLNEINDYLIEELKRNKKYDPAKSVWPLTSWNHSCLENLV